MMQRIQVIGMRLQHLPVERLGFCQSPRLVMFRTDLQGLRDGHGDSTFTTAIPPPGRRAPAHWPG